MASDCPTVTRFGRNTALILVGITLVSTPAGATWTAPRDIVHNTANTLEQGELLIGIVTPAIYGITDSITLIVHPLNWLLLSPNVGLRWRLADTQLVRFSVYTEGMVTIQDDDQLSTVNDPRSLGHVTVGAVTTFDLGAGVMATIGVGYQADFEPAEHNLGFWGGFNWLINRSNLLMLQGGAQYAVGTNELVRAQGTLMWAYAWEVARLGVGVSVGQFPVVRVSSVAAEVPVWPVIDYWGRF